MPKKSDPSPTTPSSPPPAVENAPHPEEKALSDTLMQELKASGVKTETVPSSVPVDTGTTVGKSSPAVSGPTTTPTTPPTPEVAAKEKKKFSLPKLPFGNKKVDVPSPEPSSVAQQITNDALMHMIDEKLEKMNGDAYISIKISKKGLLLVTGIVLAIIWLTPVTKIGFRRLSEVHISLPHITAPHFNLFKTKKPTSSVVKPAVKVSPTPAPTPLTDSSIRVRVGNDSLTFSTQIKTILNQAGFNHIDVLYDAQLNPKVLQVVTKNENSVLQKQLAGLFTTHYRVSSESATLTSDSDFAATILVGKNSGIGK